MYTLVYLEVNFISGILLLLILWKHMENNDRQAASLAYNRVVIATLVVIALDMAWSLVEGRAGAVAIAANYAINACYLFGTGVVSYLWLQFVLYRLYRNPRRHSARRYFIVLPLGILFILCALSPWTHWLFVITGDNAYRREPLLVMQQVISYGYMLAAGGISIISATKEADRERRADALTLSSFIVLPAIGGMINILVYGLPITWPLTVVSLLMVYLDLQNRQISTDELTGLNNRRQFDRYLLLQTEDLRRDDKLYLMLIDIDAFKKINDTYGHQAGDAALVQAAGILRRVCGVWDCFLARYGGDEFAIILRAHDPSRIAQIKEDLLIAFRRFNERRTEPYQLTISIGVTLPSSNVNTPKELVAQADRELYQAKAKRNAQA